MPYPSTKAQAIDKHARKRTTCCDRNGCRTCMEWNMWVGGVPQFLAPLLLGSPGSPTVYRTSPPEAPFDLKGSPP